MPRFNVIKFNHIWHIVNDVVNLHRHNTAKEWKKFQSSSCGTKKIKRGFIKLIKSLYRFTHAFRILGENTSRVAIELMLSVIITGCKNFLLLFTALF